MSLLYGVVEGDNHDLRNLSRGERAVRIDKSTRSLMVLDYEHHEIHAGSMFRLFTYNDALASASAINISVVTPNTDEEVHMVVVFSGTGEFLGGMYEGATVVDGAAATPLNKHRSSSNVSSCTCKIGVTVNAAGTILSRTYLGSGIGSGAHGGADRDISGWILAPNTIYLFRLTSQAADNEVEIELTFYEHTPRS